jgi:hypothetical protein
MRKPKLRTLPPCNASIFVMFLSLYFFREPGGLSSEVFSSMNPTCRYSSGRPTATATGHRSRGEPSYRWCLPVSSIHRRRGTQGSYGGATVGGTRFTGAKELKQRRARPMLVPAEVRPCLLALVFSIHYWIIFCCSIGDRIGPAVNLPCK